MGVRSAIWMNKAYLISNLEYIQLSDCLEWQTLPPFGQLPFLKSLRLLNMPKLKRLDNKFLGNDKYCVFPSLEVLRIERLQALENWFDAATTVDDCFFPCLSELYLEDCPNLHELPYLPPKLERLTIKEIGWKTLNCRSISKSLPLETLEVCCCPNITYIPLADEIARLTALRGLTIRDCPKLVSLGGHQEVETSENCLLILSEITINDPSVLRMEPLRSITTSLEKLTIQDNNELVSFPHEAEQWFLKFSELKSLQSLPSSLESLSSLKILRVRKVPQLQLLPNLPASLLELLNLMELDSLQYLKYLYLSNIPLLKSLPDLPPSLCGLSLTDLRDLSLPDLSCLTSLSSLKNLYIENVPQLRELPDLPPSLESLKIWRQNQLRELPDLPPSLCDLNLINLRNLFCLPSLSCVKKLVIGYVPQLRELPDLPPSLKSIRILGETKKLGPTALMNF